MLSEVLAPWWIIEILVVPVVTWSAMLFLALSGESFMQLVCVVFADRRVVVQGGSPIFGALYLDGFYTDLLVRPKNLLDFIKTSVL